MLAKYDFVRFSASAPMGAIDVVDPPLPASPTPEARVEEVLIEQDHVAGLGRDDMVGQPRSCEAAAPNARIASLSCG